MEIRVEDRLNDDVLGHLNIEESPFNLINWAETNGRIDGSLSLAKVLFKQDATLLPIVIRQYYGRLKQKRDGYFKLTPQEVAELEAVPKFLQTKQEAHLVPMGWVEGALPYSSYLEWYEKVFLSLATTLEDKKNRAYFVA